MRAALLALALVGCAPASPWQHWGTPLDDTPLLLAGDAPTTLYAWRDAQHGAHFVLIVIAELACDVLRDDLLPGLDSPHGRAVLAESHTPVLAVLVSSAAQVTPDAPPSAEDVATWSAKVGYTVARDRDFGGGFARMFRDTTPAGDPAALRWLVETPDLTPADDPYFAHHPFAVTALYTVGALAGVDARTVVP